MTLSIGIDLGTTNSAASLFSVQCKTLRNSEGKDFTPSIVAKIDDGDSFLVGEGARNLQKLHPTQTVTSVKRLMGRFFNDDEVQKLLNENRFPYHIEKEQDSDNTIRIRLRDKVFSPESISAEILKKVTRDAEKDANAKVSHAVVTVPAYFNDLQKYATRAACEMAGLKLKRLLPEPTAAAISFDLEKEGVKDGLTLMVFDLGGGTFDISILTTANGHYMEIAKGGDMWLGGDDIDQLLVEHVFKRVEQEHQCGTIKDLLSLLSFEERSRFMVELREKVEAAKVALSSETTANIDCFGILKDKNGKLVDIDVDISRETFESLLKPMLERTKKITENLLKDIHFTASLIDRVLMVGGSSLIPAFQNLMREVFGPEKVMVHPRPMLAISEGASIMAHHLSSSDEQTANTKLMHSVAQDYYIQLANAQSLMLVSKNSPLPVSVEKTLEFVSDTQFLGRIRMLNLSNDIFEPVGDVWYHRFKLEDELDHLEIRNRKRVQFKFRFHISEDNIISVSIEDLSNPKRSNQYTVSRSGIELQLLQRLENTMSALAINGIKDYVADDCMLMSERVVHSILQISDPLTSVINHSQKILAQRQLTNLQGIGFMELCPVSAFQFLKLALKRGAEALTDEQKSKLDELLSSYRSHILAVESAAVLKEQEESIKSYLRSIHPTLFITIARAENAAVLVEGESKAGARRIREKIADAISSFHRGDNDSLKWREDELLRVAFDISAPTETRLDSFDRDIQVAGA